MLWRTVIVSYLMYFLSQILASYDDEGGKNAATIRERANKTKRRHSHDGEGNEKREDDDDEEDGVYKGPSLCSVDQSAITGESLAVEKFIDDVAFYTCGVKRGKVYAVVTCSAKQSFVGKTAALVTGMSTIKFF